MQLFVPAFVAVNSISLRGRRCTHYYPDSKVHGTNMGPIWGRQDPGGPHIGPMNFAICVDLLLSRHLTVLNAPKAPFDIENELSWHLSFTICVCLKCMVWVYGVISKIQSTAIVLQENISIFSVHWGHISIVIVCKYMNFSYTGYISLHLKY